VYEYSVTIFESATEKFRAIKTQHIADYKSSTLQSYENIKIDLIRSIKKFPNPAAYAVESELEFPLTETILPVAKRVLVREVSKDMVN